VYIDDFLWLPEFVEKILTKHSVTPYEAEEVFFNRAHFRYIEEGCRRGEDVYAAMGQTDAGRYLIVFFIHKANGVALVLSARDMDQSERRKYGRR
jgi:uncharacterized DUF497 family protein